MSDEGFRLREATGEDAGFLAEMLVVAVNWRPGRGGVRRERVLADPKTAHYVAGWMRSGDLGSVAVGTADGRAIGAAWLRRFGGDDPGYGFVGSDVPELSLGVVEPWRGRGVGRSLLRAVARQAAEVGWERISLSVESANPARSLYLREGFATVESGRDSDTMVKSLGLAPPR